MKYISLFLLFLTACSSQPKIQKPDWAKESTRIVDNGYIVYVGTAEDLNADRAQFKAEGIALEDLANECSFVPKGARIEDRFHENEKSMTKAYVKVGLEFTACEKAKAASDPAQIKTLASSSFTEQVRKYQDLTETGDIPNSADYTALDVPKDVAAAPARTGSMSENTHFYVVRQYVAYQKEVVILSPPTAYAANSVETQRFETAIQPANNQIAAYQAQNPSLVKQPQPWSKVPDRGTMARPAVLAPKPMSAVHSDAAKAAGNHQNRGVKNPSGEQPPAPTKKKKRRHR